MSKPVDHPKRKWKREHREAGYHLQSWNVDALSHDHPVCGEYVTRLGESLTVRFLEVGHTGAPELELEWGDGFKVTVCDDSVAQRYLDHDGAVPVSRPPLSA